MDSLEQLRIETPEQISLDLPVAGIGSRFLAMGVDTLLQAGLYVIVVAFAIGASGLIARLPAAVADFLPAIGILLFFCIYWGYFAIFEIVWRGETPGKRVVGLRVIRDSGRPLDASAAVVRNLLRAIDGLPMFYGVGVICMMANRQSKRLGDLAAGTVVIHDRRPAALDATWTAPGAPAPAMTGLPRLAESEITLIEAFLQRRHDLDWTARDRSAERIVARVKEQSGAAPVPGQTAEEFLEAIARSARDAARYR